MNIKKIIVEIGVIVPFVLLFFGFLTVSSYSILSGLLFLVAIIMLAVNIYDMVNREIGFSEYEQVLDWLNRNEITKAELEATCKNYPVISNVEFSRIEKKTKDKFIGRCVAKSNDKIDEIKNQLAEATNGENNETEKEL